MVEEFWRKLLDYFKAISPTSKTNSQHIVERNFNNNNEFQL